MKYIKQELLMGEGKIIVFRKIIYWHESFLEH